MPGVDDVQLNFGASKLTIEGDISLEQINKAGAFDGIKAVPEGQMKLDAKPVWKTREAGITAISGLSLLLAWIYRFSAGEGLLLYILLGAAIVTGGYSTARKGWRGLFRLKFDMNALMLVAVSGAILIGEWNEAAVIAFLFSLSELLESYSMDKARNAIRSLMEIAPKKAVVIRDGKELEMSVDDIRPGDVMVVKPGQKIAMDGVISEGSSSINQAAITGESIPVLKEPGDELYAGTLNEEGYLKIEVTKTVEDTTLAKIIHMVEEAQAERAPSQAFVDRFARYYTPAVMGLAVAIALIPPLFAGAAWEPWIYRGLALLVVACPCALVVSTPVAIVSAIGTAARYGVLVKGGIYLEQIGDASVVAFDKTGTLTAGQPEVVDVKTLDGRSATEIMALAASLEKQSEHPLGAAVVHYATQQHIGTYPVESFQAITGKGITGRISEHSYLLGSPRLFDEKGLLRKEHESLIQNMQEKGQTVICLAEENTVIGLIAIADTVRESSQSVVARLKEMGVKQTVMLTGDNRATALAIGQQIGVDRIESELLPHEKVEVVKELKKQNQLTVMVGDGVNDAPALAASTVGIAMGGAGTDTALETADVVLMADDLDKLPYIVKLSRATLRVIKQNITFSLVVKALAVLAVFPGWLTLWLAILADMGATILVTLNGIRLIRVRPKH